MVQRPASVGGGADVVGEGGADGIGERLFEGVGEGGFEGGGGQLGGEVEG